MNGSSVGKLRGLQQVAGHQGVLTVCAMDHRESLMRALNHENPEAVTYREMVEFKMDLCQAVAGSTSAVLLDPVYGAAQAIATGVLPGATGLLVSLEKSGYTGESAARVTELLPEWGVAKIKRLGASAVKLLVYFRVDVGEVASRQLDLVKTVAQQCLDEDIPLLVESVAYPVGQETQNTAAFSRNRPELVIEAARKLTALPIDILKSQFPADIDYEKDETKLRSYCQALSGASRRPWVLLSAGASFEKFKREVEIACQSGASGFMAGRALWQEAAAIHSRDDRRTFFKTRTLTRLRELTAMADKWATPWYVREGHHDGHIADLPEGWYRTYRVREKVGMA